MIKQQESNRGKIQFMFTPFPTFINSWWKGRAETGKRKTT